MRQSGGFASQGGGSAVKAARAPAAALRPDAEAFDRERTTDHPAPRRGPGSMLVGAIALLLVVVVVTAWIVGHSPGIETQPPLRGTLVYAAAASGGGYRLWRWNLATDSVHPGPGVVDPMEIVDVSSARSGRVGITSRLPDGSLLAALVDPSSDAPPSPLLSGDLIAWGGGGTVASAVRSPVRGLCRRVITLRSVAIGEAGRGLFRRREICGDVLTIGGDAAHTYFSLRQALTITTYWTGSERSEVLKGYALIAASEDGDMLVAPQSELLGVPSGELGLGVFPSLPTLYFNGVGVSRPIPYTSGGETVRIDRVLGWAVDSSYVLIEGELSARHGLFRLDALPGASSTPRYVGSFDTPAYAAALDDGRMIVQAGGNLSIFDGRGLTGIGLPDGAPAPSGPMVSIG